MPFHSDSSPNCMSGTCTLVWPDMSLMVGCDVCPGLTSNKRCPYCCLLGFEIKNNNSNVLYSTPIMPMISKYN